MALKTPAEIENAARKAVHALYGSGIQDFKIRVLFPFPNEYKQDSWDVQTTFLSEGMQYTVDLIIQQRTGQITSARLIDTMVPL